MQSIENRPNRISEPSRIDLRVASVFGIFPELKQSLDEFKRLTDAQLINLLGQKKNSSEMATAVSGLDLQRYRPLRPVTLQGRIEPSPIVISDLTALPIWNDAGRLSFLEFYERKVLIEKCGFIMIEVDMRLLKYLNDIYGDAVADIALQQFTLELLYWVDRLLIKADEDTNFAESNISEYTLFKPNGTGGDDYSIGVAFTNPLAAKYIREFLPVILDSLLTPFVGLTKKDAKVKAMGRAVPISVSNEGAHNQVATEQRIVAETPLGAEAGVWVVNKVGETLNDTVGGSPITQLDTLIETLVKKYGFQKDTLQKFEEGKNARFIQLSNHVEIMRYCALVELAIVNYVKFCKSCRKLRFTLPTKQSRCVSC